MRKHTTLHTEKLASEKLAIHSKKYYFSLKLFLVLPIFIALIGMSLEGQGQSYLGLDGGFEGTATIDNTTINTAPQANTWTKANATQTIADETATVRSGLHSLKITNTSTTGRRVWSPLITLASTTSGVTIQYYRFVSNVTNSQSNQEGVIRSGTESLQGTYDTPAAGTWEKQTYSPASGTYTTIAGIIMHKQIGTGGYMFIDDMCIYTGGIDNAAPNAPTVSVVGTPTTSSLNVSWTAASGGVDGGGYLVVRSTSDPTTAPNVNGIYAVGNTIAAGMTVVYQGTGTSFTDNGLAASTTYYYRIYTYDKAYNYSTALTGNGTTTSSATPDITVANNGAQVTAANVSAGTTAHILHKFQLGVTTSNASLTGMTCTTAGSYASADITNLKVRYSADATLDVADATLSTYTTPDEAGAKTFPSFTSQTINSGSTGYIFITADIAAGATVGNNINVNAIATTDLTFASGNKSGSTTVGGLQTFTAATPQIALADNGTQVVAANVIQGTTSHIIHKFQLGVTVTGTNLTGLDVVTAGSYIATDITNLKVRYSTDNALDAGDATLSTYTNPGTAGTKTFPSFTSQAISAGSTGYIFVTAEIAAAATVGNNISVNAVTTGQLTFSAGTKSGSTTAGGLQTFVAPPTSCGSETFTNSALTASYLAGSFTGDNSLSWSYIDSRNEDTYGITGKGIMFKGATTAKLTSGTASGGIGNFTCSLKKGFTGAGNRQVELFVNGVSAGTSVAWDNTTVQTFAVNNINVSGDVVVEIRNITTNQVVIDDISWTCYLSMAPTITISPSTLAFSDECVNVTSGEKTYTASGINLTNDITITAPTGYQISTTSGAGFSSSITLPQLSGTVANTTIYVRFFPTLVQSYPGSITHTSAGATQKNLSLTGSGVNGPVIITNPVNQSVSNGGSANFSVTVSNASATYQWQENQSGTWANLSDGGVYSGVNTNSLALGGVTGAMSGFTYQCIVTSCAANVTTSPATLTIQSGSSLCGLEEFDNGTTAPTGWTFKSIGDTYATATNYGISSPSLKLDATADSVITANVSNVTELSVWIKGMGTTFKSKLYIDGFNSTTSLWENIALIGGTNGANEIPTTGTVFTYTAVSSYSKFSFSYDQGTSGNVGLDDVNITCTSSNTITTGSISTPPFGCNCSTGASGSVSFTSSGTFSSNTYYAQLSNASGSFASPSNIGTLVSNANSGTINFTIPPGTPSGSNYLIRIISNGPWSIGSFSTPFTVNLTGGPCSFFEIESILVDACEPAGGWEGENEMFRFKVGSTNLNTSNITVTWPNNAWLGICQNATTAATIAAINATITAGGQLIEPTGGVLPAGAEVMFFTNTSFNYTLFDFSQLNYTLYAIFQCPDNHPGHFVNYSAATAYRTLTLNFTGFGTDAVTYDAHLIYNGDGSTVDFDIPGNPTYSSSGTCESVPIFAPLPVSLLDFSAQCDNNRTAISWATATETNNDFFSLERSADAKNYKKIADIRGAGNSNDVLNYSFIDTDPLEGTSYYRLVQYDYDGRSESFGPVTARCEGIGDRDFQIVNVTNDGVNPQITYYISTNNKVNICVYDINGRRILCDEQTGEAGNRQINPDIKTGAGLYFISLTDGDKVLSARVFIK